MLINKDDATLLVVDIQEKLVPAVQDASGMVARCRWLIAVAVDLGLPVVFSEQYPQGLGETLPLLSALAPQAAVVEKLHFSCMEGQCLPDSLMSRRQVIVCGMETHVCVLQTVMGLLQEGKQVFVVADAVSSRSLPDRDYGLQRMRDAGAVLVTREMVLFECLRVSGTPLFKQMSKRYLVGDQP
jgi:nicotinamidase-related amidase